MEINELEENSLPTPDITFNCLSAYLDFAKNNISNFELVRDVLSEWVIYWSNKNDPWINHLNYQRNILIEDEEFLEIFFSNFVENWSSEPKNSLSIIFIYICLGLFEKIDKYPNIYHQKIEMLVESFKDLPIPSSIRTFWTYGKFKLFFLRQYFDSIWQFNNDFFYQCNEKLENEDFMYLCEKHGISFANFHMRSCIVFLFKVEYKDYFKTFLMKNRYFISEKNLIIDDIYALIDEGILENDFFIDSAELPFEKCSFNIFNIDFFQNLVKCSRDINVNSDFLSLLLYKIDYSVDNFYRFLAEFPENGYPIEGLYHFFRRYFVFDTENIFKIFNNIRSEELFTYLIRLLRNDEKILLLRKSSKIVAKFGFTVTNILSMINPTTKLENYFEINSRYYLTFLENFIHYDVYGLFALAKYFGKIIDNIISRVDKIDPLRDRFDKNRIVDSLNGMVKVKIIYCILNKLPIKINLYGQHITNNNVIYLLHNIHSILYGNGLENYSFIHLNRTFMLTYFYNGTMKKISFAGIPFRSVKKIDETIVFVNNWEKIYVRLHNILMNVIISDFDLGVLRNFLIFFKEDYSSNKIDYESVYMNLRYFYDWMLILFEKNKEILNIFIEETIQFLNPRFLEALKKQQYILIMKSFRAEEKAEEEINSIIQSIKRERDSDDVYLSCKAMIVKDDTTNEMRRICEGMMEKCDKYYIYKYIAKNPNSIMKCPICFDFFKSSSFISFNCGHTYCAKCSSNLTNCPNCRMVISFKNPVVQNEPIDDILMERMNF